MSSASFDANLVMETVATATQEFLPRPTETDATLGPRIIPTPLRQWLARLRLLENVPFAYVVPDSLMLPPESIRLTKRLMKQRYGEALAAAIDEETRIFTERLSSPEAKEAMSAFLEKRKPDFSRFS